MLREIGSNFWVNPSLTARQKLIDLSVFNMEFEDFMFTSTGRGAATLILRELQMPPGVHKKALLPPFTCHTVVEPFLKEGYEVSHYDVGIDMYCSASSLASRIEEEQPSVILLHNYFGFQTLKDIESVLQGARDKGIIIIEDLTHSLYSSIPRLDADYTVGSLRKWAGLPDGGFAAKRKGVFAKKPKEADTQLERMKLDAMHTKYRYIQHGEGCKGNYLNAFKAAEKLLSSRKRIYSISDTSHHMQATMDLEELKNRRRRNYFVLLGGLESINYVTPVFTDLTEDIVPLYLPVVCHKQRDLIQAYLRESDVYAPIIWPRYSMITAVCPEAEILYEKLLCIPCDQRYLADDMARIIGLFANAWV